MKLGEGQRKQGSCIFLESARVKIPVKVQFMVLGLPDSGTPDSRTPRLRDSQTPGLPDSQGVLGLGSSQDGQLHLSSGESLVQILL